MRGAQRRLRVPVRVQLRSILHWVVTWTAGRISHAGTVPATCSGRIEAAERARAERIASIIVDLPDGCGYEDGTIRQVPEPSQNAAGTYAGSHLTPGGGTDTSPRVRYSHIPPQRSPANTPSCDGSSGAQEHHLRHGYSDSLKVVCVRAPLREVDQGGHHERSGPEPWS